MGSVRAPARKGGKAMANAAPSMKARSASPAQAVAPALATPTDLGTRDVAKVAQAINKVLADTFVLYLKTKNFHWHMNGKHFRDYHLMLDEQAESIEVAIDPLAERVRKLGARTIHSYGEILRLTSLKESEEAMLTPAQMFDHLIADNKAAIKTMREAHSICDDAEDIATASLLEEYVDAAERRLWFLFETNQNRGDAQT